VRESADVKGRRYLTEGRVIVRRMAGEIVLADVRGDTGVVHKVTHRPGKGWRCSCAARGRCSHLVALQLVTAPRTES
jgi:uncharacterized Zn finger protein